MHSRTVNNTVTQPTLIYVEQTRPSSSNIFLHHDHSFQPNQLNLTDCTTSTQPIATTQTDGGDSEHEVNSSSRVRNSCNQDKGAGLNYRYYSNISKSDRSNNWRRDDNHNVCSISIFTINYINHIICLYLHVLQSKVSASSYTSSIGCELSDGSNVKTEMCRHWMTDGYCSKASCCKFGMLPNIC